MDQVLNCICDDLPVRCCKLPAVQADQMEVLHIKAMASTAAVHSKHCAAVRWVPHALRLVRVVPCGDGGGRVECVDVRCHEALLVRYLL